MFALTPVGDPLSTPPPLTRYQCTFHWLPKYSPSHATSAGGVSVLDCGTQLTEAEDEQLRGSIVYDTLNGRFLRSGDLVTLSTDDPVKRPLPHPDLLRLHAALARVIRCAAQAYDGDEEENEEDGEEDPEHEYSPVNYYQWLVPLPPRIPLEEVRRQLWENSTKIRLVWLDIVCLPQQAGPEFAGTRGRELEVDVPVIGNVYREAHNIIRYFNGLGVPSCATNEPIDMGTRGWYRQQWVTLRRALAPIMELAEEVHSPSGCSLYELSREKRHRYASSDIDKVAGLFYLMKLKALPVYKEREEKNHVWKHSFHQRAKLELVFDYRYRGNDNQGFPTWDQLLDWPERDMELQHEFLKSVFSWEGARRRARGVSSKEAGSISTAIVVAEGGLDKACELYDQTATKSIICFCYIRDEINPTDDPSQHDARWRGKKI